MKTEVIVSILSYTAVKQVLDRLEKRTAAELSASPHVGLQRVGVGFILTEPPILKIHSVWAFEYFVNIGITIYFFIFPKHSYLY